MQGARTVGPGAGVWVGNDLAGACDHLDPSSPTRVVLRCGLPGTWMARGLGGAVVELERQGCSQRGYRAPATMCDLARDRKPSEPASGSEGFMYFGLARW